MSVADEAAPATVGERRLAVSRLVVQVFDPVLTRLSQHWLGVANGTVGLILVGAFAAPILLAAGFEGPANMLYALYAGICHQWAFRSFFLLGPQATYGRAEFEAQAADAFHFFGNEAFGWKMAFCERDLAIFASVLLFGMLYAHRWRERGLQPASYAAYAFMILPMALDGFTQLFGWRESTWELRLATGAIFGMASGWLIYPRLDAPWLRERLARAARPMEMAAPA